MTRIGKQQERRAVSPRRPRSPSAKTGPKKDNLPKGFREHANALDDNRSQSVFIAKIK